MVASDLALPLPPPPTTKQYVSCRVVVYRKGRVGG